MRASHYLPVVDVGITVSLVNSDVPGVLSVVVEKETVVLVDINVVLVVVPVKTNIQKIILLI
jgi:hypothetical protein